MDVSTKESTKKRGGSEVGARWAQPQPTSINSATCDTRSTTRLVGRCTRWIVVLADQRSVCLVLARGGRYFPVASLVLRSTVNHATKLLVTYSYAYV